MMICDQEKELKQKVNERLETISNMDLTPLPPLKRSHIKKAKLERIQIKLPNLEIKIPWLPIRLRI